MINGKSGSFKVSTSNQYISGTVKWSEQYDIASNKSYVTATLRLSRTNTGYVSEGQAEFTVTINGVSKTESAYRKITYNSNTYCVSNTVEVSHDSKGEKSCEISVEGSIYTNYMQRQSKTVTLTKIPRASTMTAPNGTLGSSLVISVQKADSSFTHTITYSAGSSSGTIIQNTGDTSVSWTPAYGIANGFSSVNSFDCTLTITTYSGGVSIGTSSKSITLTIPDNDEFKPDFEFSQITVTDGKWGLCIKGKSSASVSVINAAGKHNGTVQSVKLSMGSASSDTYDITVPMNIAGAIPFTATVTDSRGFSRTKLSNETEVTDYEKPVITSASVSRCDQSGNIDRNGTYLLSDCAFAYSSVEGNNSIVSAKLMYRPVGSTGDYYDGGSIINGSTVVGNGQFNIAASYEILLVIEDGLGETDSYRCFIPTSECVINVNNSGNGIGIGKYSENEELLDIKWDARIRGHAQFDNPEDVGTDDTGWNDMELGEMFTLYDDYTAQYRKVFKTVEIRGVVTPVSSVNNIAQLVNGDIIATLPSGFRPQSMVTAVCQGSGIERWLCMIEPNGNITACRYEKSGASHTPNAHTWMPFSVTFFIG